MGQEKIYSEDGERSLAKTLNDLSLSKVPVFLDGQMVKFQVNTPANLIDASRAPSADNNQFYASFQTDGVTFSIEPVNL